MHIDLSAEVIIGRLDRSALAIASWSTWAGSSVSMSLATKAFAACSKGFSVPEERITFGEVRVRAALEVSQGHWSAAYLMIKLGHTTTHKVGTGHTLLRLRCCWIEIR